MLIQVVIQSAFIAGPILGGFLTDDFDQQTACVLMAEFSLSIVALYATFSLAIYCLSKWDEPEVDLDVSADTETEVSPSRNESMINTSDADFRKTMHALQSRKRKNDDLGTLLKFLTDNSEDGQPKKRKKGNSRYLPQVTEHADEEEKLVKKNL
jgi:hypothetical protein